MDIEYIHPAQSRKNIPKIQHFLAQTNLFIHFFFFALSPFVAAERVGGEGGQGAG